MQSTPEYSDSAAIPASRIMGIQLGGIVTGIRYAYHAGAQNSNHGIRHPHLASELSA